MTTSPKVNISACARCGRNHNGLDALLFAAPPTINGVVYPYWARCPNSLELILVERAT